MPGHGTVNTGSHSEGDSDLYIDNTGGSRDYGIGEQEAVNLSGETINQGDVVNTEYTNRLEIISKGERAIGTVNSSGTQVTITSSGDTQLTGTVNISEEYGNNSGWAGSTVSCANVDGEAAYLAEA